MVGNQAVRDSNLSLKAKGLLVLMLSYSEGWVYRLVHLERQSADGQHATKTALRELMAAGYVVRERQRANDGTFQWLYTVDDEPFAAPSETTPQVSTGGVSTGEPAIGGNSTPKKPKARKSSSKRETPSRADARGEPPAAEPRVPEGLGGQAADAGPQAVSGTPHGVAADAAGGAPSSFVAGAEPSTRHDVDAATPAKGSAGAARPEPDHQTMVRAIREALYPGTAHCADRIERQLAAASKQLRGAGLDSGAPALIVAHIRTHHPWRTHVSPGTLVEYSAEWASARANPDLALTRSQPARSHPVSRPQTTAEATQRSVDTASAVLAHLHRRGLS